MIYNTVSYWVWVLFFTALTLLLCTIPLFNILGFEFCAVMTICIAFAGSHVAMTHVQAMKNNPDSLSGLNSICILRCYLRTLQSNFLLLTIPLCIILLNAERVKNCNYIEGFFFFISLPIISCLTVSAIGLFFNVWIQKRWHAYSAYIGFLLLSCVPIILNLIFHPPVFAFHPILGYFPGPIYDFVITITPPFYIARGIALLWTIVFLYITITACEISRDTDFIPRLRWGKFLYNSARNLHTGKIIIGILILISVISIELFSGKLWIRPTRNDIAQELGGYKETEHFEIFYAKELEEKITQFADDCEFRYFQLSNYLKTSNSRKVRTYLYSTPQQKKRLIGAGNTYVEDPFGYGFHVHIQGFPHPVVKHELAHVLTADWSPWKVSLNVGVHEGIAVAADWSEDTLSVHQWAKGMHIIKVAPRLNSVMGIGFWRHAGSRSYLLAGSFIRYLIDKYGIDNVKLAFPTGNLRKVYSKELTNLEEEWIEFLMNDVHLSDNDLSYAERRLKSGGIFEQVCAHEMAALRTRAWQSYQRKDFATAVEIFHGMLEDEPNNQRTIIGLMYSAFKKGDLPLAIKLARRISADVKSHYKTEAGQLVGDVNWMQGNIDNALTIYNETALNAAHNQRQLSILKRIAALSETLSPQSKEQLQKVLLPKSNAPSIGSGTKTTVLLQVIESEPDEWLPYILIGELLHKEKSWELSSQYLQYGLKLGMNKEIEKIPFQLTLKTQQMLGINAFELKDYGIAEIRFREISEDKTQSLGIVLLAKDWIERCQWMNKGSD